MTAAPGDGQAQERGSDQQTQQSPSDGQVQPSGVEGSWDAPLRAVFKVLKYAVLVAVVVLVVGFSDTPYLTALRLALAALLGAVLMRLLAGSGYLGWTVLAVYFGSLALVSAFDDPAPLGVLQLGFLLGLVYAPIDTAERDRRALAAQARRKARAPR